MTVTNLLRRPIADSRGGVLCDFLRHHARQKPDQTAFIRGNRSITWATLDETSTGMAHWFAEQGLKPGDRIAVCSLNSIELVQVYLGLLKAGLIAVPINTRLKPEEVRYILDHAGIRMAFCESGFMPLLEQAGTALPVFAAPPEIPAGTGDLPDIGPDNLAMIVYTSGTTARPKGVAHTHGSLAETGLNCSRLTPGISDHVRLHFVPMMHISGVWFFSAGLREGTPTVLLPRFEPGAALDAIEQFGCTTTGGLPTMLLMMVEEQLARPRQISTLRSVIGGGDAISQTLQQRFREVFGLSLHEIYAMTELCPMTGNRPDMYREGSLGVPLDDVDLRVVDMDGRDLAEGETGEIIVRGPGCCAGYWDDPEATRAAIGGGWLHTGDLGARDADGFVWFKGRKKEVIIRAGSNISPQEVEEALYKHPAVLEAGVIGVPDPQTIERVAAFVVLRDGHTASAGDLCAFAKLHIADYKAPEEIHFRDTLPKNPVGKIQRRALKEMLTAF